MKEYLMGQYPDGGTGVYCMEDGEYACDVSVNLSAYGMDPVAEASAVCFCLDEPFNPDTQVAVYCPVYKLSKDRWKTIQNDLKMKILYEFPFGPFNATAALALIDKNLLVPYE